ncbi:ABC transporter ATP-binding protein [Nocardioides sp.]|uniref:ABC transporter ATP-binding protein n=1 Tax=Nocardioides sp. TaxID=35761 RepID=UPI003513BCD8
MLRTRALTARAATGEQVLHGIDLELGAGQCLGVIGASGAGKSTLVRALLGLQPSGGEVRWWGEPIAARTTRARALRRRVQYVPQDPVGSLDPRRPLATSLREPLRALGVPGDAREHRRRISEALECVGIDPDIARRRPGQLSGGQVQRVAIARALAIGAEVIVADEPLSAVDRPRRAALIELWARLRVEQGLSLLLVTHDLPAVAALCDRVAVLAAGHLVDDGPTAPLFAAALRADPGPHAATRALVAAVPALDRPALLSPGPTTSAPGIVRCAP